MKSRHCVSIRDFSREELDYFCDLTIASKKKKNFPTDLNQKVVSTLFLEPSTRTKLSFQSAAMKLGMRILDCNVEKSSLKKGESLHDTIKMIENYSDILVIRHFLSGAARFAAEITTRLSIINAGDGISEHPSQTLLDLMTIKEKFGTLNGLHIGLLGDLLHSRTIHSLIFGLIHYKVKITFISLSYLRLPHWYETLLEKHQIEYQYFDSYEKAIQQLDILYVTRIQKERFIDEKMYNRLKGCYILDENSFDKAQSHLIVMHPLPRIDEIHPSVDKTPYAHYFQQSQNGLYLRQVLLQWLIEQGGK